MKPRRVLLALLLALLAVGAAPPLSAYAGGPTSVLMVNPNAQQARAAYYSDPGYDALVTAVGEGQTGPDEAPPGVSVGGGEDVRLTWLIHDMTIWRIDRIHLTSGDGVWIETVVDQGGGSMFDRPAHWHRPADEAALTATLSTAGLLGDAGAAPSEPPAAGTPAGGEAAATVPASPSSVPGLAVAGLVGLVLGAAGALVGVRARTRTPIDRPDRVTLSG